MKPAWPELPDALVPLESVSNGCGGCVASNEPRFADISIYLDSNNSLGKPYFVSFRRACNLHDAGYSGAKVEDPINGGTIDYYGWSRERVDDKFLADTRKLCDRRFEGTGATVALADCKGRGGKTSWGAETRCNFVRRWGHKYYRGRPTLLGFWSGGGVPRLVIRHSERFVAGTWQNGDVSGEFRGTLISRDQDSIVRGFAQTTVDEVTTQSTFTITVDPNKPNEIFVSGPSLRGTMTR